MGWGRTFTTCPSPEPELLVQRLGQDTKDKHTDTLCLKREKVSVYNLFYGGEKKKNDKSNPFYYVHVD